MIFKVFVICGIILGCVLFILLEIFRKNSREFYQLTHNNSPNKDSVIIGGCARDIAKFLSKQKKKLEKIGNLFSDYRIIIFENDSKDNTSKLLYKWSKKNRRVHIITEKNIKGMRTERLSHARNTILKYIGKKKYNPDILVIADLDNIMIDNPRQILLYKTAPEDWVVLGANTKNQSYYDLWALRTYDNWMPGDCWCENDPLYKPSTAASRKIKFDDPLIKVKSCFGGLGMYRYNLVKNSSYDGVYRSGPCKNAELCEHVSFNYEIRKKNPDKSIYIHPKLLVT